MEKFFEEQLLYDYYGTLLTDHQQSIMNLYYEENLGLSEISERLSVSRQAVYDTIQRSLKLLRNFESQLLLIEREEKLEILFTELIDKLNQGLKKSHDSQTRRLIEESLEIIDNIQNEM